MIMIVDDDPDMLLMMSTALEREGYHVNARAVPPNWIELRKVHPTLIFMDVELMPYNGARVCRSIKENFQNWPLAIVLTSGHTYDQLAQEARYCHADAFLTKPFDRSALMRMADRYVHVRPRMIGNG